MLADWVRNMEIRMVTPSKTDRNRNMQLVGELVDKWGLGKAIAPIEECNPASLLQRTSCAEKQII